ncbi:MAG: family 78 glycoside hydrolase catalytic domain [Clostridia bacterium]|nr:family 78 glycoside hydrolase catalytic domain [Clostridia bacterium]
MKKVIIYLLITVMLAAVLSGCVNNGLPSQTAPRPEESPLPVSDSENSLAYLRVNYETEPECVEGPPVFSWTYNSLKRSVVQKSYRIRLAESRDDLASEKLIWDSGNVQSRDTYGIEYSGETDLKEASRYYWDVICVSESGDEFYGGPASFSTALTETGFTGASWIKDTSPSVSIELANWIWLLKGDSQGTVKIKTEYFKYVFNTKKEVKSASALFSADDCGYFYINGAKVIEITKESGWQHALIADITEYLTVGRNIAAAEVTNTEIGYGALIAAIKVEYKDGSSDIFVSDRSWYSTANKPGSGWEKSDSTDGFQKVNSVTEYGRAPWYSNCTAEKSDSGAPMLRGEFNVNGKVKSAFLFASAAGLYDAYVNGKKADDSALNPGRSEYQLRVMYQSFDVTELLNEGKNVLGAVLGRGWYIGAYSPYGGVDPAFISKLVIDYEDGRREYFATDGTWKICTEGPVLADDIFNGETYDARKEIKGWAEAECAYNGWEPVETTASEAIGIGELVPQLSGKVTVKKVITAQSYSKVDSKTYIYDFGQNLAGVPSIKVKGRAGTEVVLRHAEMLNDGNSGSDGPKGTLYTANLRSAKATDKYILKGDPSGETYVPSFTFHGFRYLEISGLNSPLPPEDVKAVVLYSDLEDTGRIETSDDLINKLFLNTLWGQRGNFLSVPTDCPQRDERMGWSGDAQIFCGTAAYNMNVKTFFDKYITDLNDCQHSDGSYPDVAPETGRANYGGSGNNAWGDAGVIIPWIMYERYGDISYIVKYYDNMCKYAKYLLNTSNAYIRERSAYGDWLSIGESTPVSVTDTAYCIRVFDILVKMAELLGKSEDADKFAAYAEKYRKAWISNFVKKEGRLTCDTQTAYLVALAFDILPEESRAAMAQRLNNKVIKRGTLTTGFIGCSLLLPVLCEYGYTETAFMLLQQEEYPSWKYPILQGATTIWERWNSYTVENGFGDAGMNSFNHYSYGSVTEWLYDTLTGIKAGEAGNTFRSFVLRPTAGGGITYAKGEYNSVCGMIVSEWTAVDNKITTYKCSIPGNTEAKLIIATDSVDDIRLDGVSVGDVSDIKGILFENGICELLLGSGDYSFTIGG